MELKERAPNPGSDNKIVTSALLDSDNFSSTSETLQFYVEKNKPLTLFLRVMGILWTVEGASTLTTFCQVVWNSLIRLGIGYMLFEAIFIAIVNTPHASTTARKLLWIVLGVTLALQSIALVFVLYDIYKRLKSTVSPILVQNLSSGLKSSYVVLAILFLLSIVPFIIGFAIKGSPTFLYATLMFGNIATGLVLAAAMYFIALDCAVATSLLDQLLEQQKLELLTCEQFSMARDEVKNRQANSAFINDSIVVVALLDVCCVLFFSFVNLLDDNMEGYLIITGLFLKDIPFLMVVYWQVAQVNEKSALLIRNLGAKKWSMESHLDHERVSVYINAQSNPIVMSLAGMKLKRKDLAWQFALWCLAFVVSFLKAAVTKRVE